MLQNHIDIVSVIVAIICAVVVVATNIIVNRSKK